MTEAVPVAMDTDAYTATAFAQIEAGTFYNVSHSYNIVRIEARYDALRQAYATWAHREGKATSPWTFGI